MRPLKLINDYFDPKPRLFLMAVNIAILFFIGAADYLTGYKIEISIFYMIPVSFAAWFGGKTPGIIISCLSVLTMAVTDVMAGDILSQYIVEIWNLLMRLGFFAVYSVVLSIVKADLNERRRLIEELQKALGEVKQLSGILPICASCKKIRDDQGYWEQIESYIRDHSEARFSHGICPECVRKLYPDNAERILGKLPNKQSVAMSCNAGKDSAQKCR